MGYNWNRYNDGSLHDSEYDYEYFQYNWNKTTTGNCAITELKYIKFAIIKGGSFESPFMLRSFSATFKFFTYCHHLKYIFFDLSGVTI